jgi:sugar phosphate isomerase/epimerase
MPMNRRELLAASAAAGVTAAVPQQAHAAGGQGAVARAEFRVSSQEGIIPARDMAERLGKMEKWGFDGLEIGGGGFPGRVEELKKALASSKIKISAICAGTPGGPLVNEDPETRKKAVAAIKDLVTCAAELGSTGVIIVPAFNGQTKLGHVEARKALMEHLAEIGEHGAKVGGRILLEPLNRNEAWFLRQLADAGAMCREANSAGVGMMGDFYHMGIEEPSDMGAFISAGKHLHHVHLASRKRVMPGQDERDFTDGFRGLKAIGYRDFCSFECGCEGDREVEIPKAVKFLRAQWKAA